MAERNHYEGLFKQYTNNIRKSWVIIKEIINKKQSGHTSDTFLINEKPISDNKTIADAFNSFYVNIGSNIAKEIPVTSKVPYILADNPLSMYLMPTDCSEISNIIKLLKVSNLVVKSSFKYLTCHYNKEYFLVN